jgi:hypothetical protein
VFVFVFVFVFAKMQVIPEALQLPRVTTQNDEKVLAIHGGEGVWGSLNTRGRVFPTESEVSIKDPARTV